MGFKYVRNLTKNKIRPKMVNPGFLMSDDECIESIVGRLKQTQEVFVDRAHSLKLRKIEKPSAKTSMKVLEMETLICVGCIFCTMLPNPIQHLISSAQLEPFIPSSLQVDKS